MKSLLKTMRNSQGVVMVVAMLIMLAVAAIGIGMITSAAMSSTIAKNYRSKIQAFYAADGQMTVLSQSVIDSLDTNWLGHNLDTLYPRTSFTMTSLTNTSGNVATRANDGDTTTYWENDYTNNANKDTAWLKAALVGSINVSKVVIVWDGVGAGNTYNIQGSTDATNWTTLSSVSNNTSTPTHRRDTLSNLSGSYNYIRMAPTARNGSGHGYRIDEMSLYAYKNITNRTQFGNYTVQWTINILGSTKFKMQTMAWDSLQKWGLTFKTPLNQYIELGHDSLLTAADSVYAQVTFYDYHSNRTNPEFEQPCLNASGYTPPGEKGMVGTFLDASRRPVLGPSPCEDYNIAKWWRSHPAGDSADSMIPIYHYTTLQYTTVDSQACTKTLRRWRRCAPIAPWGCTPANVPGCYGQWGNANASEIVGVADEQNAVFERTYPLSPLNDTAYKNVTIQDSLQFVCINHTTGTYQFNKTGWWVMDGRGFGAEWTAGYQKTNDTACEPDTSVTHLAPGVWPHNFSWTMCMNRTFVKTPNDTFMFTGDDDIWLFLNNRLVMDLGGPQSSSSMTVLIDTCFKHTGSGGTLVPGDTMVNNGTYNFDFFYCERHSVNSDCRITTNMLTMKPVASTRRSFSRSYGNLN
jgi:fibro-slime domain-containing protein